MTPKEIAQWVIDNRYPENDKIPDHELYHELINKIESITVEDIEEPNCGNCKHCEVSKYIEPCHTCMRGSDYPLYERKQNK